MARTRYAMKRIASIEGVTVPLAGAPHFREFLVKLDGTGKTVAEVNRALLARGIFGGVDLSKEFPEWDESALYCVTEVHGKEEIDRFATALEEVVR